MLADKEQLLKENTDFKLRIEQLKIQIEYLTNQNIDLENKNKDNKQKIDILTIMNIEILKKLRYYIQANFTEFQKKY